MKHILLLAAISLTGCLVQSGPAYRSTGQPSAVRSCPPAHHWEGGACVHNGRAEGHRDHDHGH
ncbi:MAG: hypothetical protein ACM31C_33235 [Acidobacteriota bacterium]